MNRLCKGHDHHRFVVRSVVDDPIVGFGLLNDLVVMTPLSPPHYMLV